MPVQMQSEGRRAPVGREDPSGVFQTPEDIRRALDAFLENMRQKKNAQRSFDGNFADQIRSAAWEQLRGQPGTREVRIDEAHAHIPEDARH